MFKILRFLLKPILIIAVFYFILGLVTTPSTDRNWTADQKTVSTVEFAENDIVYIKNIRNISYRSTTDYDVRHYDKEIDINTLESAWFLVEPFGKFGAAHTLVSFGFSDGTYLSISVEIRKEVGEVFSSLKGLTNQYELSYVIADENDVVKLRTNYRNDEVILYPIKAEKDVLKAVFTDMLMRAEGLNTQPEFYNAFVNNCTTNIVKHAREFSDKDIPWLDFRYIMPKYSDKVAYNAGIIDTKLSLEEARKEFNITKKAQKCSESQNFSACIRD